MYPSLVLFPAGKIKAIPYKGHVGVTDIINFIANHGLNSRHLTHDTGNCLHDNSKTPLFFWHLGSDLSNSLLSFHPPTFALFCVKIETELHKKKSLFSLRFSEVCFSFIQDIQIF